jgi:hypothetical protein
MQFYVVAGILFIIVIFIMVRIQARNAHKRYYKQMEDMRQVIERRTGANRRKLEIRSDAAMEVYDSIIRAKVSSRKNTRKLKPVQKPPFLTGHHRVTLPITDKIYIDQMRREDDEI